MSRDWETDFRKWGKKPSDTELKKCDNAISVITNAINSYEPLQTRGVTVHLKGSYANSTNVRKDSDVDVYVLCKDTFFDDYPQGLSRASFGYQPATYFYSDFRKDVIQALSSYQNSISISIGNKAIELHENTYRVNADVVPCFEYRSHFYTWLAPSFHEGTVFYSRKNEQIVNWPVQNIKNSTDKNNRTNYRYKRMVRVLKTLKNELDYGENSYAAQVPSYLMECLVWNVPDDYFGHEKYVDNVVTLLAVINKNLTNPNWTWMELNNIKPLFGLSQPWTKQQVSNLCSLMLNYILTEDV